MNRVRACVGAWAVLWACAELSWAQPAQEAFNSIFGADVKKVTATSDPRDDIELGGLILRSAKETKDANDLLALLCENAYALLARHASGYAGAVEAMELLGAKIPARRSACQDKILAVRQKQYQSALGPKRAEAGEDLLDIVLQGVEAKAAADQYDEAIKLARTALATITTLDAERRADLMGRIKSLTESEKTQQLLQQLKDRLKASPGDETVRSKIVLIYLAELDKPGEAAKFLTPDSDETLRTYVPLAAKEPEAQPEQVCMELGDWYRELADSAAMPGKAVLLRRAKGYYEAFLAKHTTNDLAKSKATLTLDKVQKDLEKLGPAATLQWVDVLRYADASKPIEGEWHRQGRQVGFSGNRGSLAIPVVPNGSYEMTVTFVRQAENRWDRGSVVILVPVAGGRVVFTLSGNVEQGSGLQNLRGGGVRAQGFSMENRRQYVFTARITVTKDAAEITSSVNGRKFADWKGQPSDVSRHWDLGHKYMTCLAVGANRCEAVFDSVKVRMISGSLDRLREGSSGGEGRPPPGRDGPAKDAPAKERPAGETPREDRPPRERDKGRDAPARPGEPPAPARDQAAPPRTE